MDERQKMEDRHGSSEFGGSCSLLFKNHALNRGCRVAAAERHHLLARDAVRCVGHAVVVEHLQQVKREEIRCCAMQNIAMLAHQAFSFVLLCRV